VKKNFRLIIALIIVIVSLVGCPKDEIPEVKEVAGKYWFFLFSGQIRPAYNLLNSETRNNLPYGDYARRVGFGPTGIQEVKDYWNAYYPQTEIEVGEAAVKKDRAVVAVTLTQPDPKWFPDEAYQKSVELGLEGNEQARFIIKAHTDALNAGLVPIVKIQESTNLVKEGEDWKVVFTQ
jgi:hypothetical protein